MLLPSILIAGMIGAILFVSWACEALDRSSARRRARAATLREVAQALAEAGAVTRVDLHSALIREAMVESLRGVPLRDAAAFRGWFRDLRNLRALVMGTAAEQYVNAALGWATELQDSLRAEGGR